MDQRRAYSQSHNVHFEGGSLRRFGTVSFTLAPGARRLPLPIGRRLTSGRYVLELKAGALSRRVQFRMRAA